LPLNNRKPEPHCASLRVLPVQHIVVEVVVLLRRRYCIAVILLNQLCRELVFDRPIRNSACFSCL